MVRAYVTLTQKVPVRVGRPCLMYHLGMTRSPYPRRSLLCVQAQLLYLTCYFLDSQCLWSYDQSLDHVLTLCW